MKSRRQKDRSSCQRKKKFSEATALKAAEFMQSRYSSPFRAYQCRWCGRWHVGKPIKQETC